MRVVRLQPCARAGGAGAGCCASRRRAPPRGGPRAGAGGSGAPPAPEPRVDAAAQAVGATRREEPAQDGAHQPAAGSGRHGERQHGQEAAGRHAHSQEAVCGQDRQPRAGLRSAAVARGAHPPPEDQHGRDAVWTHGNAGPPGAPRQTGALRQERRKRGAGSYWSKRSYGSEGLSRQEGPCGTRGRARERGEAWRAGCDWGYRSEGSDRADGGAGPDGPAWESGTSRPGRPAGRPRDRAPRAEGAPWGRSEGEGGKVLCQRGQVHRVAKQCHAGHRPAVRRPQRRAGVVRTTTRLTTSSTSCIAPLCTIVVSHPPGHHVSCPPPAPSRSRSKARSSTRG
mmetsp:Transcript_21662/g.54681  ORF Transcript_21662/g.54681 Transcript_21662/m.54681 type:complete len:339 (-) Transcript_21662:56-1072(-)